MNPEKISQLFCVFPSEGWELQNFETPKNGSFYHYIINHNECSLAWISVQTKIRESDLVKNNFKRENPFEKGLNLYRPLLLIVTDETDWYISTLKDQKYTKKSLKSILQIILTTLRECINLYRIHNLNKSQSKQLFNTAISLNKRINSMSEVENKSGVRKSENELYPEVEAEDSYEAMYRNGLERIKSLEGVLRLQSQYLKDNSYLLHYTVFKNLSPKQLKSLCNFHEDHIYINPWYKKNQLLVKTTPIDVYLNVNKKKVFSNHFYILDSHGDFIHFSATPNDIKNTMYPGFMKFDKEYTKEYLKKLSGNNMKTGDSLF